MCFEMTTESIGFIFDKGRRKEPRQEESEGPLVYKHPFVWMCFGRVAEFLTWVEDFLVWPEQMTFKKSLIGSYTGQ